MRTTATGQRLAFSSEASGWGFNLGADAAWVAESIYLPESLGYDLTDARLRVRGGIRYVSDKWDAYYGLAWLSEEFEAQPEGQFVGTFQIRFGF